MSEMARGFGWWRRCGGVVGGVAVRGGRGASGRRLVVSGRGGFAVNGDLVRAGLAAGQARSLCCVVDRAGPR